MGQKVNPVGFRTGIMIGWKSRWYASKQEFAELLVEDQRIRGFIKDRKEEKTGKPMYPAIAKIEIERTRDEVKVILFSARPGVLIGRKGERVEETNCEINLKADIRIPEDYLPQSNLRLNLYKRLASVDDLAEIDRIREEVRDRFGPVPETIENLLRYGAIKHLARRLRIRSIDRTDSRVVFRFLPGTPVDWGRVPALLKRYSGSLSPQAVMSLTVGGGQETGLLDETVRVLKELST